MVTFSFLMSYLAFFWYTCYVVSLSILPWSRHCNDRIDFNASCDSFRKVSSFNQFYIIIKIIKVLENNNNSICAYNTISYILCLLSTRATLQFIICKIAYNTFSHMMKITVMNIINDCTFSHVLCNIQFFAFS